MSDVTVGHRRFAVSRTDKILFPDDGITKGDLLGYYERVAETMIPHVRSRPVMMQRFPNGIAGHGFMQKNLPPYFPDWIARVTVEKEDGRVTHVLCQEPATLVYLANQACITPHVWLSCADRPDYPDELIFDLDPPGDHFAPVRKAALALRNLLDELGLTPYVKTTGSRGLHVVAPLDRSADFDVVRDFVQDLSGVLAARHAKDLTTEQRIEKRRGRVFLDTLRNAYAQTAVPPYAVRAKPGAPVATPLDWEELKDSRLRSNRFTLRNLFRRLDRDGDPWRDMRAYAQSLDEPRRRLAEMVKGERRLRK